MTFKPIHWKSQCTARFGAAHVWMVFEHNKGWKQLAGVCSRCNAKTYMSDRQWDMYIKWMDERKQPARPE